MANRKENGEQFSVDELVSKLKENIGSSDDAKSRKTIAKKANNPDKDIASMLKKFMPDQKEKKDDFELEETVEENTEFDLEGDFDYDVDMPETGNATPESLKDKAFELDDNNLTIDDVFVSNDIDDKKFDFAEPDPVIEKDNDILADSVKKAEEKTPDKKKNKGGLFSHKKDKKLADGYAKMLEMELEDAVANTENAPAHDEFLSGEEMPAFDEIAEETPKIEPVITGKNNEPKKDDLAAGAAKNADNVTELPEYSEPVATKVYVFETLEQKNKLEEEEYFAPDDKKPLAFEDDDYTPIVPDGSAFENVARSDVSKFADDNSDESPVEDAELDDKDINLMMALGYEKELEEKIGKDKVDKISGSLSAEIVDFIDVDNAFAFDGFELNSSDQYRTVGGRYKEEHKKIKTRLIGSGIFSFALLVYEFLMMLDVTADGALNIHHYPVVGIMLSLQFLVLSAALSWRQLIRGLTDMITFAPSPNSIPAFAVLMTVIYDVIMALIAPNTGLQLYNFPAALCILFIVLNDYFNLSREIRAFHTIATKAPKYAVSASVSDNEQSIENKMMSVFDDEVQAPVSEKRLDTYKLGFVENYFRRTNVISPKDRKLNLVIYPFLALAIALGVVSYVTNHSGMTAFNISILTVLLCTPLSMIFIRSFSFFGAAKTAFDKDAAIIGETSIEEYADATSVSFSDSEVFPVESTVTRGIKLYDNNAIYYVLYNLTSIYSKIGGPLKVRLEQATAEMGHSDDVVFNHVEDKGVEAIVDGKVKVLAGQEKFMTENGITIVHDPDDDKMTEEGCSVLYLVLDGVLGAKLYVQYDIDHGFEDVINILADEKMETLVYTSDPCIDSELLLSKLNAAKVAPQIVKCEVTEGAGDVVESAESGIVARHSLPSLASTIALCNKIRRVRKTSKKVSTASMIISVIMMVFLALFSSKLGVPSIYVALYQIFWMLPLFLFTRLYVK